MLNRENSNYNRKRKFTRKSVGYVYKLIKSGKIKLNIRFTNNKNLKFRKKEHTCFFVICDAPVSHCKKSVEECIVFSMACVSCKLPASLELKTIKDSFSNKSYVVRMYGPLLLRFCEIIFLHKFSNIYQDFGLHVEDEILRGAISDLSARNSKGNRRLPHGPFIFCVQLICEESLPVPRTPGHQRVIWYCAWSVSASLSGYLPHHSCASSILSRSIMFACIFFSEDSSLSVVGRKNKSLKVINDEWEPRGKVEMLWPGRHAGQRTLYHGTIIKISGKSMCLI